MVATDVASAAGWALMQPAQSPQPLCLCLVVSGRLVLLFAAIFLAGQAAGLAVPALVLVVCALSVSYMSRMCCAVPTVVRGGCAPHTHIALLYLPLQLFATQAAVRGSCCVLVSAAFFFIFYCTYSTLEYVSGWYVLMR